MAKLKKSVLKQMIREELARKSQLSEAKDDATELGGLATTLLDEVVMDKLAEMSDALKDDFGPDGQKKIDKFFQGWWAKTSKVFERNLINVLKGL